MKVSPKASIAVLIVLSRSLTLVDAFATSNSKLTVTKSWAPLYFKNELLPDVENEVLVSEKGSKQCCKGCPGCPFGSEDSRNITEPSSLKVSGDTTKKATLKTNYQDTFASEGLPLFHSAALVLLECIL